MGVDPNVSRRTFLTWYMAGLMTATLVAAIAPILVYVWPPAPAGQKNTKVKTTPDTPLDSLAENDAIRFKAPDNSGFYMEDGGGDNSKGEIAYSGYAVKVASQTLFFAVNCSHLGCSINWVKDKVRFECPCHGSRFAADGKVIHGPAQFPLSHLKVEPQPDGTMLVDGFILTPGAS